MRQLQHLLVFALVFSANTSLSSADVLNIYGAGSTFVQDVYEGAVYTYQFVNPNVKVNYHPTGSGGGLKRLMQGSSMPPDSHGGPYDIDFCGSDEILTDADYTKYPDLQLYPAIAGAVVPIYNIPELLPGMELILHMQTIVDIFSGKIQYWNHSSVLQYQNADVQGILSKVHEKIKVFVRSDSSGTTEIFKNTLSNIDPMFNTYFGIANNSNTAWNSPYLGSSYTFARDGNPGVASGVVATPYAIGYSVLSDAVRIGLRMASVIKPGSTNAVKPSEEGVEFAVSEKGMGERSVSSRARLAD
eukprot:763409-Hanusia_phi.AAC.6